MIKKDLYHYDKVRTEGFYCTKEVAEKAGLSVSKLLYLEKQGVVRHQSVYYGNKKFREYSKDDLDKVVLVKLFLDTGLYTIEKAVQRLKSLA